MRGSKYEDAIAKWVACSWDGNGCSGTSKHVRRYLLEQASYSCQRCGFKELNTYTNKVPLELHHTDGNPFNSNPSNLEVLCPNCHSLTENYRNAGKRKSSRARRLYTLSKFQASQKRIRDQKIYERIEFLKTMKRKRGWIQRASEEWHVSHTQVTRWVKLFFPEFLMPE